MDTYKTMAAGIVAFVIGIALLWWYGRSPYLPNQGCHSKVELVCQSLSSTAFVYGGELSVAANRTYEAARCTKLGGGAWGWPDRADIREAFLRAEEIPRLNDYVAQDRTDVLDSIVEIDHTCFPEDRTLPHISGSR